MKRVGDSKGGSYAAPWRERIDGPGQPTYDKNRNLVGHDLGPEYLPASPKTGRAVAQSTAERHFAEGFGYVGSDGLWDHAEDLARGSSAPVQPAGRYDAEQMDVYAEKFGHEMTAREWELYALFWQQRLSYGAVARQLDIPKERVNEGVKRLRVKLHSRGSRRARSRRDAP